MSANHMIRKGSDDFERGMPVSAMASLLMAMAPLGLGTRDLFASQAIVLVEDGERVEALRADPSSFSTEAGLAVLLPPGSSARVRRLGGRSIFLSALLDGSIEASTAGFDSSMLDDRDADIAPLAAEWLERGERGASSEALCKLFFMVPIGASDRAHPHDPSDLGRCLGFLEATLTESRIREAAVLSPQWAKLVERWDDLRELYRQEASGAQAPKTYALLRQILEPAAEPARPSPMGGRKKIG